MFKKKLAKVKLTDQATKGDQIEGPWVASRRGTKEEVYLHCIQIEGKLEDNGSKAGVLLENNSTQGQCPKEQ